MKTLKYRAWYKTDKTFLDEKSINRMFINMDGRLVWYCSGEFEFVDEAIETNICTGLIDISGKEIYEGDIVETLICFGPAGSEKRTITVCYNDLGEINIDLWVYNENEKHWPTIIGNIYENPELLK